MDTDYLSAQKGRLQKQLFIFRKATISTISSNLPANIDCQILLTNTIGVLFNMINNTQQA